MDETLVHGDSLCNCLGAVVAALVIGEVKGLERAVVTLEILGDSLAAAERHFICVQVEDLQRVVLEQVLHDNVHAVVTQLMLPEGDLLQANVVSEHLAEVNRDRLTYRLVYWVVDIELLERVVRRVQHGKDTDNTIVIHLVVAKVQRDESVVREQQLSDDHCAVRLDLVAVQVQILQRQA